jgi:hypothetical protein
VGAGGEHGLRPAVVKGLEKLYGSDLEPGCSEYLVSNFNGLEVRENKLESSLGNESRLR